VADKTNADIQPQFEQRSGLPEDGHRILLFSGGTALNRLSKALKSYTHNSIHLITPFDSGGSSAELRKSFDMPAIGDIRNRMMALSDETRAGYQAIHSLFTHRFAKDADNDELRGQLDMMCEGRHDLVHALHDNIRPQIHTSLCYVYAMMPDAFDLRGASIGNLILTGGYLDNSRKLNKTIRLFSRLIGVNGNIVATVDDNLQLTAYLEDGRRVIGQHRLTGKEQAPLTSRISSLSLTDKTRSRMSAKSKLDNYSRKYIYSADLICYPPGSFYTSLIANLLPVGVGAAIAGNTCPKVYIPNLGQDPEQIGMTMKSSITTLLHYLGKDNGDNYRVSDFLNLVLFDSRCKNNLDLASINSLKDAGIQFIDTKLVNSPDDRYYDPELLASALVYTAGSR
jgi:CofD-related protein of GAK system